MWREAVPGVVLIRSHSKAGKNAVNLTSPTDPVAGPDVASSIGRSQAQIRLRQGKNFLGRTAEDRRLVRFGNRQGLDLPHTF
jgi:hypothetical protein